MHSRKDETIAKCRLTEMSNYLSIHLFFFFFKQAKLKTSNPLPNQCIIECSNKGMRAWKNIGHNHRIPVYLIHLHHGLFLCPPHNKTFISLSCSFLGKVDHCTHDSISFELK